MAGQAYGKLECYSALTGLCTTVTWVHAQEFFKGLYDFLVYLEAQGVCTLRARYAGDGAVDATATDYWDEAKPFTNGAWYLYEWRTASTTPANPSYAGTRTEPFYILVQYFACNVNPPTTGSGAPCAVKGNSSATSITGRVGIQMGVGVGGSLDPWNGTLGTYGNPASFGNQAKGNPVWTNPSGGSGLYVFPRSNSDGGSYKTAKENMLALYGYFDSATHPQLRYSFIADHDGLIVLTDDGADANYNIFYTGGYIKRSGSLQAPYLQFGGVTAGAPVSGTTYGDGAGTANLDGGIAFNSTGPTQVRVLKTSLLDEIFTGNMQPNKMFATPTYDEQQYLIGVAEYYDGYAGKLETVRAVQNVANLETNTAGTRLFVGVPALANYKASVPWNPSVLPGSGLVRAGTTGTIG